MQTTVGDVRVEWGLNRWVLVMTPRGDVQRRVSTQPQLTNLLEEAGLPRAEAASVAAASHTADADSRAPRRALNASLAATEVRRNCDN